MSAVPTHANPLAFLPCRDGGTDFVDDASNFVARNARILKSRPISLLHHLIAVADTARFDFDSHPVWLEFRDVSLDKLQTAAGL